MCAKCGRMPHQWTETARFHSSEMYWRGCKFCDILEGGKKPSIADWNWNRRVRRFQYEMAQR